MRLALWVREKDDNVNGDFILYCVRETKSNNRNYDIDNLNFFILFLN